MSERLIPGVVAVLAAGLVATAAGTAFAQAAPSARAQAQPTSACVVIGGQNDGGNTVRFVRAARPCTAPEVSMSIVTRVGDPFFADPAPLAYPVSATLLAPTATMNTDAPLLVGMYLDFSGDPPQRSKYLTVGGWTDPTLLVCMPLIDGGMTGLWTRTSPMSTTTGTGTGSTTGSATGTIGTTGTVTGSTTGSTTGTIGTTGTGSTTGGSTTGGAPPAEPNTVIAAWYRVTGVPAGPHQFSVVCQSTRPFRVNGTATLTVLQ